MPTMDNEPTMRPPFALAALLWVLSGCSAKLDLGSNDAGIPYDADCKPGTYTGTYACSASSGSPIQFASSGPITVTLVPSGASTLSLTPDASLASTTEGTTANSVLSGVLDCPTRQLTGVISDVAFSSTAFKGVITGTGTLTAVYDTEGGPPALLQGVLDPPPTLATTCTWTATLE
jgi:hypothetical protein